MLPDLTPAVTRALAAAARWAERLGACDVEPRHLLLALLEEDEGRPVVLLREHGLVLFAVREKLAVPVTPSPSPSKGRGEQAEGRREPDTAGINPAARFTSPPSPLRASPPSPLVGEGGRGGEGVSPATAHLLLSARRLATDLAGETTVASEHLMLAILQHDLVMRQALEPIGLDVAKLEAQMRSLQMEPLPLDEPLQLLEPTEQIDAARILDANANRAREALRVVEDYCRFVLDDAFLSGELKRLRHDLAAVLAEFSPVLLLEARETLRDVGTDISTDSEQQRQSLVAVVQANLKRLQEALRCLEEYAKLRSSDAGSTLEALRYRSYTLERAIVLGAEARQRLADARLYVLVTGALCTASLEWTIKEAVAGGAQIVQLREKTLNDQVLLERARWVRRCTREVGALFMMNDRPDIARLAEADGVHVGQEELPVKEVRRIVGPHALIGVSTHNLEQVRQAVLDGANYIGVGPCFASATKNFEAPAGLEFVRQAAAETSLPAFAIGGIILDNVAQVVAAGLRRVAVSHAICTADDPQAVAATLRRILDS